MLFEGPLVKYHTSNHAASPFSNFFLRESDENMKSYHIFYARISNHIMQEDISRPQLEPKVTKDIMILSNGLYRLLNREEMPIKARKGLMS